MISRIASSNKHHLAILLSKTREALIKHYSRLIEREYQQRDPFKKYLYYAVLKLDQTVLDKAENIIKAELVDLPSEKMTAEQLNRFLNTVKELINDQTFLRQVGNSSILFFKKAPDEIQHLKTLIENHFEPESDVETLKDVTKLVRYYAAEVARKFQSNDINSRNYQLKQFFTAVSSGDEKQVQTFPGKIYSQEMNQSRNSDPNKETEKNNPIYPL